MKRLLIPLLAALALPTAVSAGDLGVADIEEKTYGSGPYAKREKKSETYQSIINSDSIEYFCGQLRQSQNKCTVQFKNGLLSVDGSKGIKPEQVKHFSLRNSGNMVFVDVFYISDNSELLRASFYSGGDYKKVPFYFRFMRWMNTGNK